ALAPVPPTAPEPMPAISVDAPHTHRPDTDQQYTGEAYTDHAYTDHSYADQSYPDWPYAVQEIQRQTAEAHAAYQAQSSEAHATYQRLMADSHLAFLKLAESSYLAAAPSASANGRPRGTASPAVAPSRSAALPPAYAVSTPMTVPARVPLPEPIQAPVAAPRFGAPAFGAPQPPAAPVPVPVVHAPAPVAAATPPEAPGGDVDLEALLLSVVSDKTGYPVDMLESSMELEADLGIDSIKRVEILSALRTRAPRLPEIGIADLGTLRSLGQIVERLRSGGEASPDAPQGDGESGPAPPAAPVRSAVRTVEAAAGGLAVRGLYDTSLAVLDGGSGIAGHVVAELEQHGIKARPATGVHEISEDARGVVLLHGLAEPQSPEQGAAAQLDALRAARAVAARIGSEGGLLVTVQDTGGDFGLDGRSGSRSWTGGLAGLARTAAREWPGAGVKAVDCERSGRDGAAVAAAVVRELLTGGSTVNAGLRADGTRLTLRTVDVPAQSPSTESAYGAGLGPDSVIVATGGARGVTGACLLALARRHRPRLVLLGRTPLVEEPAELRAVTGEAELMRAVLERIRQETGGTPRPAEIGAEVAKVLAAREARAAIEELERAGSQVRYAAVDVRDGAALSEELARVRSDWGPITGVVHGAGVIADRSIAEKTDEQFRSVFDTKVLGLHALLTATEQDPLTVLCAFSSTSAWFGNAGQSDYAMANETLNEVLCAERAKRPDCVVRAIGWGPWEGGMVNQGLAEHFRGQGIGLLPLHEGAEAFVAELEHAGGDVNVIIAAPGAPLGCRDSTAEVRLSRRSHPYLEDHAVADTPVLPLVMALEWFTAAARARQDRSLLRDLKVLRRVELPGLAGEGHRLLVETGEEDAGGGLRLRLLGHGGTPHYRATAHPESPEVSDDVPTGADTEPPPGLLPLPGGELYDGHTLFHGPAFRALLAVDGVSADGAVGELTGAAGLGWGDGPWCTDPAALDGGLQLAVLWARQVLGSASLPMSVREFRLRRSGLAPAGLRCVVRAGAVTPETAECDIHVLDPDGAPRARLLGVTLVARPG
ncbi:SDR family oxidoreductase, partial [Streptomyces phyllanthi]